MSFVEGKYDGSIPAKMVHPGTVEEDLALFWALLDYPGASYSADKSLSQPARDCVSSQESSSTFELPELSVDPWHSVGGLQDADIEPEFAHTTRDVVRRTQLDMHDIFPEPLEHWDPYEGFANDWSFLGRPWLAYAMNDGWFFFFFFFAHFHSVCIPISTLT